MKKTVFLCLAIIATSMLAPAAIASERAEQGWLLIEQGAMIVDVRTPREFAEGHLDNAVNFPLSELDKHFKGIVKDKEIVLYCRSGNRSGKAYQYLQSKGFTNLHNAGGFEELQNVQ
ncbi:rhodanese-like domain-containing protein [uncultured Vibrio sp.]|uniref:rhodanese-like domain-containing protein n=1 Tax=uncultured Vibrio sp. TaxID=114054 RepID=UPI002AA84448|nr:rhodanese-like domain-containing protein [uncultured Vibrio sp.]